MNHSASYFFLLLVLFACPNVFAQYTADDWKWRDSWMHVDLLFQYSNLYGNAQVADVGCHEGYLTMHLSEKVGLHGMVYAVDVRSDRLATLQEHAAQRSLKNIKTIQGAYDNPKLPENKLDVIYVIDTYHEMDSPKKMLRHFKEALKPGGRLLLLEKIKKHMVGESRSAQVMAHTLSRKYVKKELKEAGFILFKEIENFGYWEEDTSKQMWVLVAQKPLPSK